MSHSYITVFITIHCTAQEFTYPKEHVIVPLTFWFQYVKKKTKKTVDVINNGLLAVWNSIFVIHWDVDRLLRINAFFNVRFLANSRTTI